ncbi:MAG: hypothetical protein CMK80_03300, partial [Pseudomonadales bacterium]|nr:hypothetical protein [Pseudomonadales bacterium]
AGLWMCLFALTSSLKPAFLFLSFPGFREEPFFCPPIRHPAPPSAPQPRTLRSQERHNTPLHALSRHWLGFCLPLE